MLAKPTIAKQAAVGGEPEKQFEVAFSQLALAYVQDSAPELIERLIGFQLVDRNDDRTKAFGVFGFQLGDQVAYAPVIFISGEIKGNELLYLPKLDMFVPLSEKWVNFLLSQGTTNSLGSSAIGSPQELGIMPPNITPLVRPPIMAKRGSKIPLKSKAAGFTFPSVPATGWHPKLRAFAPMYGALTAGQLDDCTLRLLKKHASLNSSALLEKILRVSPGMTKLAMDLCDRFPAAGYYMRQFHGKDVFERALTDQVGRYQKEASQIPSILKPNFSGGFSISEKPDVRFITSIEPGLTDKQASLLARQGYVVEDARPMEKLSAAGVRVPQKLANPTQTGIYQLLTRGGSFVKALIIVGPKGAKGGDKAVAKELDGNRWISTNPGNLWVRLPAESYEEYRNWWNGLGDGGLESGSKYVCVTENAEGSVAFNITEKTEDGDAEVYMADSYDRYADPPHLRPAFEDGDTYENRYDFQRFSLSAVRRCPGSKFRFWEGVLEVPEKAKCIKLSGSGTLEPGKQYDIEEALEEKTAELQVRVDGPEVSINRSRLISKFAGFKELVVNHGFSEADARFILKEAEAASVGNRKYTIRVAYGEASAYGPRKSATAGLLDGGGISSPPFPDPQTSYGPWAGGAMEQMPMEHFQPVGGLGAMYNDPSTYDPSPDNIQDPMLMQQAQQAGETGQKEFFDTSMLSQLAKGLRPQNRIQEWTRDLLKSMDRLGRILLLFFWHNEEFADRYGKNDLPDLEDAIRNAFDAIGEVALFLKEKDVEPLGGLQSGEASVENTAG